jgi:hypothetical protein
LTSKRSYTKKTSSSIEQEAEKFLKEKLKESVPETPKFEGSLSSLEELRFLMAASILSGLLSGHGYNRAEELVDEALKYTDLILSKKR